MILDSIRLGERKHKTQMTKSIFYSIGVAFLQNIDEHLLRKLYTKTLVRQSSQSMFPVFHGHLFPVLFLTEKN